MSRNPSNAVVVRLVRTVKLMRSVPFFDQAQLSVRADIEMRRMILCISRRCVTTVAPGMVRGCVDPAPQLGLEVPASADESEIGFCRTFVALLVGSKGVERDVG